MKKILTLILAFMLMLTIVSCGPKDEADVNGGIVEETLAPEDDATDVPSDEPTENPTSKPTDKPAEKPAEKPTDKPTEKPTDKPTEKPTDAPKDDTLGKTLLSAFKKEASGKGALEIAEALVTSEVIKFSGGAMAVEEGLLSGFDNTEITGFKSGAMFAPMIGSIPFVGYVFELANEKDVPSFISTLKDSANLRWNICVAADEMVTGSSGNKVFFVMCPTALEE